MELLVNAFEAVLVDMGVNLGGGDIGMAEHFLHDTQIGPAAEKMRGERMPQHVRRDALFQPRLFGVHLEQAPNGLARKTDPALIQKKVLDQKVLHHHGTDFFKIFFYPKQGA